MAHQASTHTWLNRCRVLKVGGRGDLRGHGGHGLQGVQLAEVRGPRRGGRGEGPVRGQRLVVGRRRRRLEVVVRVRVVVVVLLLVVMVVLVVVSMVSSSNTVECCGRGGCGGRQVPVGGRDETGTGAPQHIHVMPSKLLGSAPPPYLILVELILLF